MADHDALKDRSLLRPTTSEAIQAWLISRLAEMLKVDPIHIDVRKSFADFGLDSTNAVILSGDLEEWLGREMPGSVVYQYPTIALLADHLAKEEIHA